MIKAIFLIFGLIICYQILFQKDYKKIIWLLGGILFFPQQIILTDSPFAITLHRLFIYTLLFNTLFKKDFYRELKRMPVFIPLILILVAHLITGLTDGRLDVFLRFYRPVTLFVENFFVLFLAYYHIKNIEDTRQVFKKYIWFLLIFCIYGISNYITKTNEYFNVLEANFGASNFANINMDLGLTRFRISSFAFHAILYGLFLSIGILISFYLFFNGYIQKNKPIIIGIVSLIFLNLLLVNSRTPIIALMGGLFVFFFFGIGTKAKIQLLTLATIFGLITVFFLGDYTELVKASLDVFSSETSEIGGSSIEMRKEQLKASFNVFALSPITGNGFEFIGESLGLISRYNKDALLGVESYLFKLIIEQGIVGIVSNLMFFFALFYFSYKNSLRPVSSKIAILTISILIAFLLFILGTGALTSFTFFMILLGVSLKGIVTSSNPVVK